MVRSSFLIIVSYLLFIPNLNALSEMNLTVSSKRSCLRNVNKICICKSFDKMHADSIILRCSTLVQLPALRPSWGSTPLASQTTSLCRGKPRRAPSPTWLWLRMRKDISGRVTPAAPPVRYLLCPVGSSTESTPSVSMKSASEPRAT